MSLVTFHRVLISAAILFFLGYGGWELKRYTRDSAASHLLLALAALIAAIFLILYLRRLRRFLRLRD